MKLALIALASALAATLAVGGVLVSGLRAETESASAAKPQIEMLFQDLDTLRNLSHLRLSAAQLRAVQKIALEVASKGRLGPPDTPEVRDALDDLRQALLQGEDGESLDPLYEKLEQALGGEGDEGAGERQREEAIHAGARQTVDLLTASQLARVIGGGEEEDDSIAGPLLEAVHGLREIPAGQRHAAIAERAARFANRFSRDAGRTGKVRSDLEAWLKKAAAIPAGSFEARAPALLMEAEKILEFAAGSALDLLRIRAENRVGHIFRNPRLAQLIQERLGYAKPE